MAEKLLLQFIALSIYAFLMGFIFCDFFKLHILRKLIWFIVFLTVSVYVLKARGEFDLGLILPLPMLLAIWLGWVQKRRGA
jgi:cellulose synthase/poly-beta-1,6-N-acetylglucosamine synthase-like glycosyltransferase